MPKILKFRRGTTAELAQITGAEGEIFVNLDTKQVHVHDGVQTGGYPLATTIDPVFDGSIIADSALIGGVSIIENTVAATDAYGQAQTLVVASEMDVTVGENNVIDYTEIIPLVDFFYHPTPGVGQVTFRGLTPEQHTKYLNLQSGEVISFITIYNGQEYQGRFTITGANNDQPDQVSFSSVTFSDWVGGDLTQIIGWWDYPSNVVVFVGTVQSEIISTPVTPLSVTESGVAIVGALTVNGQGVGVSYDQSLNTTDDVIFNSALIGDVSIIGNEVAVEDAYGLPGTLAVSASEVEFSANVNLAVNSIVETPDTITSGTDYFRVTGGSKDTPTFDFESSNSDWADASKFVTGSVVSFTDSMYGPVTVELTTDMAYSMSMMRWQANYTLVSGGTEISYTNYTSNTVTVVNTSGSLANYSFDDQGTFTSPTVSTDNLLVAGSPAGLMTVNQDGSKSVVIDTTQSTTETISAGGGSTFELNSGNPGTPLFYHQPMGTVPYDVSKFAVGTIVSISSMSGGSAVVELTSDFTYNSGQNRYSATYTLISGSVGAGLTATSVTVTNSSGSVSNYDFTTAGFVADSALIGDVSIVGNQVAVEDAYGGPGTLAVAASEVEFSANVDVVINSFTETTETVTNSMSQFYITSGNPGTPQFYHSPISGSGWSDASKFVTGSVVTLVSDTYGTKVIELTSDMTYDNMDSRWEATYTLISGSEIMSQVGSSSVTVTNTSGTVATYGFDDQGTFTAPTVSTDNLLVDGVPASLLTTNEDGSKSIVVGGIITTTETISAGSMSSFQINGNMGSAANKFVRTTMGGGGAWDDSSKFVAGTVVTLVSSMYGTFVIELTSSMTYDMMNGWTASYTVISGGSLASNPSDSQVTITNTSGSVANYDFTSAGFVADSALIGDVSIVGNQIAVEDAYGLPGTLAVSAANVDFSANVNLSVGTISEVTEVIVAGGGSQFNLNSTTFNHSPMGSLSYDTSKLVVGTVVSMTDYMSGQNVVIQLTTNFAYDNMDGRYEASYIVISGSVGNGKMASSVTITNTSGTVANYGFDDQGTFSTPSLLVNGVVPAFLNANEDGSKSIVVDTTVSTTETVYSSMADIFKATNNSEFVHTSMSSDWSDVSKFVPGTLISLTDRSYGETVVVQLTSSMTYSMAYGWKGSCVTVSGTIDRSYYDAESVSITNTTGSIADYGFDDQGTFTTTSLVADSALIGDVSIVGNQIAVQDSYGVPGTLAVSASEVEFDSNLNLAIDSRVITTETVDADSDAFRIYSNLFIVQPPSGSGWSDASKFVTGTQVTIVDYMFRGTIVIELTTDFAYDSMDGRWEAEYTIVSGTEGSYQASSVTIVNTTGSLANYGFDDQGTFSTPSLLVNGVVPAFLNANEDGSKSIVATGSVSEEVTLDYLGFSINPAQLGLFVVSPTSFPESTKFTTGVIVSMLAGAGYPTAVIQLTSDLVYNLAEFRWEATYSVVSGAQSVNTGTLTSDTVTITYSQTGTYDFDILGTFTATSLVAESALIGNMSMVENTITPTDAYGQPDTLTIEGDLSVTNITTASYELVGDPSGAYAEVVGGSLGPEIRIYGADQPLISKLLQVANGSTIVINSSTYGIVNVTLTTQFAYDINTGGYTARVDQDPSSGAGLGTITSFVYTTGSNVIPLSVTAVGVAIEGTLTVDGQDIITGYQPIGINTIILDSTNVLNNILVSEVKSTLFISPDPAYTGSDAVNIALPIGLTGQRITIFNGSANNTCTILNAYSISNAAGANVLAPQSALNVIHLTGGNWYIC